MFSLLVTSYGQPQMEMATIGKEGIVGASEVLQTKDAFGLNLVQIPGTALRIGAEAFRKLVASHPRVPQLVHDHMYALVRFFTVHLAIGSTAWKNVAPGGC